VRRCQDGCCVDLPDTNQSSAQYGIEAVQAELSTVLVETQALVAQPGGKPVRAEQSGEEVTLDIAVTAALLENFRCGASHRSQSEISGMPDVVANPFEATSSDRRGIGQICPKQTRPGSDGRMLPVDDVRRSQKLIHRTRESGTDYARQAY
jgi:hypothetical protein